MRIIKAIIFYPLFYLRRFILTLLRALCGLTFFATLIFAIIDEIPNGMAVFTGIISFGSFLLCQLYDYILLRLNPTDDELILLQ